MIKNPEKKPAPKSNLSAKADQEKFFGGKGFFDAVNGGGGNGGGKTEIKSDSKIDPAKQYQQWQPLNQVTPIDETATKYSNPQFYNTQITGTKELGDLQKDIDKISATGDAKAGIFVTASIQVKVPIPQVPGLSIVVGLKGKYVRYGNGKQKLSIEENLGVEFDLLQLDIIKLSAEQFLYLNLDGDNLGDAYIDALKQTVFYILEGAGVGKEIEKLAKWKTLSNSEKFKDLAWDYLEYGAYFGPIVQITKVTSCVASAEQLQKAYQLYHLFFKNDAKVGFELGIGGRVSAELDLGEETGGKLSAEAIAGLEDKIGSETKAIGFGEVAVAGEGELDGSKISFRLSKRWRGNGSTQIKFELGGEFKGNMGLKKETIEKLKLFLKSTACMSAFQTVSGSAKDGEGISVDIGTLITAAAVIPLTASKKKIGIDISFTREKEKGKDNWAVEALLKEMQGFGKDKEVGGLGIEMKLDYGTFVEISGEIEAFLKTIYPEQSTIKVYPFKTLPQKNPPIRSK